MFNFIAIPELAIFLAIFTPTISFCALNRRFFTTRQLTQSIALAAIVAGASFIIATWGAHLLSKQQFVIIAKSHGILLVNMLYSALGLGFFIILHQRFFTECIPNKKIYTISILVLFLIFVGFASLYSIVPLNIILAVFLLCSFIDAYKKRHEEKHIIFESNLQNLYYTPKSQRNIELKHKPNIYFLLLESYHSAYALKKLYDIDDHAVDNVFEKHGFKDYKNFFSNRASTERALNTLLNCSLLEDKKRESLVFEVLRENNYTCEFFDIEYFVFGKYMAKGEYASFYMSKIQHILHATLAPIWAQSAYLRKIIKSTDPFNIQDATSIEHVLESFKLRLNIKQKNPRFLMMRFGADHASPREIWKKEHSEFIDFYKKRVLNAQLQIVDIVDNIIKKDPDACIIALGDHGSLRHNNAWLGNDHIKAIFERGVSIEELALDQFAVRCAIRWPSKQYPEELFSHVQVFSNIFQCLGADAEQLPRAQENISILPFNAIAVRDGKILSSFEPYTPNFSAELMYYRFKAKTASLQDCINLSSLLDNDEVLEVLTWAKQKYPESDEIKFKLANLLFENGYIKESLHDMRSLLSKSCSEAMTLFYAKQLVEVMPLQALAFIERDAKHIQSTDLCYYYACACLKLGHDDKALEYVDILMSKHRNNPNHHYYASCILLTLKNYTKALHITKPFLQNTLAKHINNMYHELSTFVYILAEEWDLAEYANKGACEFRTRTSWNWILQAHINEKKGKPDSAYVALAQGLKQADNKLHMHQALGRFAIKHYIDDADLNIAKEYAKREIEAMTKVIIESQVVNKNYYKSQLGQNIEAHSTYWHYMNEGFYAGIDFVPWFNSLVYLLIHPPLFWAGVNPFLYYLSQGVNLLHSPSIIHNPRELLAKDAGLQHARMKDNKQLLHSINKAWGMHTNI